MGHVETHGHLRTLQGFESQPTHSERPGRCRHQDREAAALLTWCRLAFDPTQLLRLPRSMPGGERMSVKLLRDQIRQRHHPERGDIPHYTIDQFREVPARVLRVRLAPMAMALRVPIAARVTIWEPAAPAPDQDRYTWDTDRAALKRWCLLSLRRGRRKNSRPGPRIGAT